MALKNPLGKIKDAAVGTLKDPIGTAHRAAGQARGAAAIGKLLAGEVSKKATELVASRRHHAAPVPAPRVDPTSTTAPVAKKASEPIHAPAAPQVETPTPADLAKVVAKKPVAARKAAATKPPAKKPAAKKSAPGAKLPPRKAPADEATKG